MIEVASLTGKSITNVAPWPSPRHVTTVGPMSGIDQYLTLLQNGAYASIAAAIISGINLLILVRLLSRNNASASRRDPKRDQDYEDWKRSHGLK